MDHLIILLHSYGLIFVFAVVVVEQMGLPIPAFPVLTVAGALSVAGGIPWHALLLVSVLGCLMSDLFWYRAGRVHGRRVLRWLCMISVTPDACVSQTEHYFRRFGPKSLLVAKFIPGFSTVAPPLAGAMDVRFGRFLLYSVVSGLLWAGMAIALGIVFHASLGHVIGLFNRLGHFSLVLLAAATGLFVVFKFVRRESAPH
jgi:membrane protein DedA with SNARE-associated domain